jgi:hypothetical protein
LLLDAGGALERYQRRCTRGSVSKQQIPKGNDRKKSKDNGKSKDKEEADSQRE